QLHFANSFEFGLQVQNGVACVDEDVYYLHQLLENTVEFVTLGLQGQVDFIERCRLVGGELSQPVKHQAASQLCIRFNLPSEEVTESHDQQGWTAWGRLAEQL